jgi:hypothetical protein
MARPRAHSAAEGLKPPTLSVSSCSGIRSQSSSVSTSRIFPKASPTIPSPAVPPTAAARRRPARGRDARAPGLVRHVPARHPGRDGFVADAAARAAGVVPAHVGELFACTLRANVEPPPAGEATRTG